MWNRYVLAPLALVAAACSTPQPASAPAATPAAQAEASSTGGVASRAALDPAAVPDASTVSGVVAETMNSGGYTYARLTANGADTWIAGNEFALAVGDQVTAAVNMPMERFRSRTLNREFALIYFVSQVARNGEPLAAAPAAAGAPSMMGSHGGSDAVEAPAPAAPSASLIAPVAGVPGAVKIAQVWATRQALSGKAVVLRGQVVKANYEIMGTNWYHVQDGSGVVATGTHDLVVTSSAQVKVGEVVTVSGVLATGKDFGAGYAYDAIVEQAQITK